MQREIKFRVWDISKKVFIPTDTFAVTTSNFSYFAVMIKDWEDYRAGDFLYPVSQSLSQFIDLKDKNGKDIYDGDILECDNLMVIIRYRGGQYVGIPTPNTMMTEINNRNWLSYQVIGNIYENPKLVTLKQKQHDA